MSHYEENRYAILFKDMYAIISPRRADKSKTAAQCISRDFPPFSPQCGRRRYPRPCFAYAFTYHPLSGEGRGFSSEFPYVLFCHFNIAAERSPLRSNAGAAAQVFAPGAQKLARENVPLSAAGGKLRRTRRSIVLISVKNGKICRKAIIQDSKTT